MPNDHFSTGKKIAFTASMFLYLFLIIASFWIFKPLKKTLFIDYYKESGGFTLGSWEMLGSQAEHLAKMKKEQDDKERKSRAAASST